MKEDPSMDLAISAPAATAPTMRLVPRQDQIPELARLNIHLSCGPKVSMTRVPTSRISTGKVCQPGRASPEHFEGGLNSTEGDNRSYPN
jgi:hypothetical protein